MQLDRNYMFIYFLLSVVFFSGFIDIPFSAGLDPATLIIDACYILMFIGTIFYSIKNAKDVKLNGFTISFLLLFVLYCILILTGNESFYTKILSLRDKILYLFIAIFIFRFIKTQDKLSKLLNYIMNLGIIFGLFGIFQYLFRHKLPLWLLTPKNTDVFTYYGTDIVRSTGLLGNPIIFGNIMVLFFSIFSSELLLYKFTKKCFLGTLISLIAIITTFSRAAMLGAVFVLSLAFLIFIKERLTQKRFIILVFILTGICLIAALLFNSNFIMTNLQNSFIYNGLFNDNNASVQGSTTTHMQFIFDSIKLISLFGLGIGTQREGSIYSQSHVYVTDSCLMANLLESGVVTFLIYSILVIITMVCVYKSRKIRNFGYLATGFFFFSLYEFFFANIINSAYFGKVSYIIYWTLAGIIFSAYKLNRNKIKNDKIDMFKEDIPA